MRTAIRLLLLLFLLPQSGCGQGAVSAEPGIYTEEELEYFAEIALGSEYGSNPARVHKWTTDVGIRVHGEADAAARLALEQVVADLNGLVGGIRLRMDDPSPEVEIHFIPEERFGDVEPNYVPVNLGFFWAFWNERGECTAARILIATDERVTARQRAHLVREELTQSLGLMRDSDRYPDSIFYEGWTEVTAYSPLDRRIIEMLYRPEIRPNMTRARALDVLRGLR